MGNTAIFYRHDKSVVPEPCVQCESKTVGRSAVDILTALMFAGGKLDKGKWWAPVCLDCVKAWLHPVPKPDARTDVSDRRTINRKLWDALDINEGRTIPQLMQATGLSERQIANGIARLREQSKIAVEKRYHMHGLYRRRF